MQMLLTALEREERAERSRSGHLDGSRSDAAPPATASVPS